MLTEQKLALIDLKRYAQAKEVLEGELSLADFSLPTEILEISEGVVHYQFCFGVDEEQYVYIHGYVKTNLKLECQRCLKPMIQNVCSEFYLSPVRSGQEAQNLPSRYEAVFLDGDRVSLPQIVEEELILNLPIAPSHSSRQCQIEVFH